MQGANVGMRGNVFDGESLFPNESAPSLGGFRPGNGLWKGQECDSPFDHGFLSAVGTTSFIYTTLYHHHSLIQNCIKALLLKKPFLTPIRVLLTFLRTLAAYNNH